MSDLISREQAIKAICKLPVKVDDLGYTWMIANDVIKQVDDVPSAEPKREWIPVTEALPEEDIDVLLQFPKNLGVGYQEDGVWDIATGSDLYSGLDEKEAKPIAWMPLPEVYRCE